MSNCNVIHYSKEFDKTTNEWVVTYSMPSTGKVVERRFTNESDCLNESTEESILEELLGEELL